MSCEGTRLCEIVFGLARDQEAMEMYMRAIRSVERIPAQRREQTLVLYRSSRSRGGLRSGGGGISWRTLGSRENGMGLVLRRYA